MAYSPKPPPNPPSLKPPSSRKPALMYQHTQQSCLILASPGDTPKIQISPSWEDGCVWGLLPSQSLRVEL